jgi:nucleotide-binding universal stress UspA family protein
MDRMTALTIIAPDCATTRLRALTGIPPQDGVHLSFLVAGLVPSLPIWAYGSAPYGPVVFPENWHETYQDGAAAVTAKGGEVEALLQATAISGDVTTTYAASQNMAEEVASRAGLSDLVLIDDSVTAVQALFDPVLDAVLFRTPVAAVLNAASVDQVTKARHVLAAWDGSLPALRALHRALPILRQADMVTVLAVDPASPAAAGHDLATWLVRAGCKVTLRQAPRAGRDIADAILDTARDLAADLVVMGAYVHSRARQRFLGGTTQIMLTQKDIPLLLAH